MSSLCPGKPWQTKLSSAGLVYLHFGHKLLAQLLGTSEKDSVVDTLYDKVGTVYTPPSWPGTARVVQHWTKPVSY